MGVITPQDDEVNSEIGIGSYRKALFHAVDTDSLHPAHHIRDPFVTVINQVACIIPTHFIVIHEWLLPFELKENDATAAVVVCDEINVSNYLTISFQFDAIKAMPSWRREFRSQFLDPSGFSLVGSIKPILSVSSAQLCPEKYKWVELQTVHR